MRLRFQGLEVGHTGHRPGDVLVTGFDPGYPEVRSSDSVRGGADGVVPGRDFLGASTLSFDLASNRDTMVEARATIRQFLAAWRDAAVRLDSGVSVPLDFQVVDDPRWYRVYGRPRRSDNPDFGVLMRSGVGRVTCEFDQLDVRTFAGSDSGLSSSAVRQFESGVTGGGWSFPMSFPVSGAAVAGVREGSLSIGGEVATPILIEFHGPGRRLALDGNRGWHVGLRDDVTLAYDEVITIDPLTGTVRDNFGEDRYAALDKRTPLSGVQLTPGMENVFFSGFDQTNTAHAIVRWRDAYSSL